VGEWVVVDEPPPPKDVALLASASLEKTQNSVNCVVIMPTEDGVYKPDDELEVNASVKVEVRIGDRFFMAVPRYNIIARRSLKDDHEES